MQRGNTILANQKIATKCNKKASMNNNKTQQRNANEHQGSKRYLKVLMRQETQQGIIDEHQ